MLLPGVFESMATNDINCEDICSFYRDGIFPWNFISELQETTSSISSTFVITATFSVLAPSLIFFLYLGITAVVGNIRGSTFLEYPDNISQTFFQPSRHLRLVGSPRTSEKRAAVAQHCACYIFRHSVFRRHRCVVESQSIDTITY